MTGKFFFAAAVGLPFMLMAGIASAGPTSSYPPPKARTVVNGPYAQFVRMNHADNYECRYQGGPKSPIWHQPRVR